MFGNVNPHDCNDWNICYPEGTPHFQWINHDSDDNDDYEPPDEELELADFADAGIGLKQFGTYIDSHYKDNPYLPLLGFENQNAEAAKAANAPILTPDPLAKLAQWPMGGYTAEEAIECFQNSSIGLFFIDKYPVKVLTQDIKDGIAEGTIIIYDYRHINNYLDLKNITLTTLHYLNKIPTSANTSL